MTVASYKPALSLVLAHEGGYANHPKDPGGATMKGITQRVYDDYRRVKGLPLIHVRYVSPEELAEIYKKQYWRLVRGDDLPAGLDYAVFDFAVNSGVSRAVRYLQRLVGVDDDGIIGNGTLGAVFNFVKTNEELAILLYCANRLAFLKSLKTFPTFGKGWTRRVVGLKDGFQMDDTGVVDYAVKMAHSDLVYQMPKMLDLPAKAYAEPEAKDIFPTADTMDLQKLIVANDLLAAKIALSGIAA